MDIVSNRSKTTVGILLIDGFAAMSYASTTEPMRAANLLYGQSLYQIHILSEDGEVCQSSGGAKIIPNANFDSQVRYDLIFVIAGGHTSEFDKPRVFRWLRKSASLGAIIGGVSAGPVLLAAAGLMQGYRMTVHWEHSYVLRTHYPDLLIEKTLYIIDRKRITSAGGIAPMDMMHAIITYEHGADFARKVSDWFMHTDVRNSTAPQRSGLMERFGVRNSAVLAAIEIMKDHLADTLDLPQLASLCDVSPRQLNRLFRQHLQIGTMAFYRKLRLDEARILLEKSTLSVGEIAYATGFVNPAHFSSTFQKTYTKSPSQIRLELSDIAT